MSSFRTVEISDRAYESHGLRFLTVKSKNLKGRGDICLFVPAVAKEDNNLPIYILLHGVYGSSWAWAMKGGAAHSAQVMMNSGLIKPAIIAMPSDGLWGDGSGYFSHHDRDFEHWIVSDVRLAIIENIEGCSKSSKFCIGGLSMGGYGALMLGAKHPDLFQAISAHSSITKLEQMRLFVEEPFESYAKECDLPDVIDAMIQNKSSLPAFRFDCGKSDKLFDANLTLHDQLVAKGIAHRFEAFDGAHDWTYWQEQVKKTFLFFDRHV